MNQPQFIDLIQNPSKLAAEETGKLKKLVDEFPYCPATHLLFTKALYDQKSMQYHAQLKRTAVHIPDRSILYWLIKSGAGDDQPEVFMQTARFSGSVQTSPEINQPETNIKPETEDVKLTNYKELNIRLQELSHFALPQLDLLEQKLLDIRKRHEQRIREIVEEYMGKRLQAEIARTIQKEIIDFPETPVEQGPKILADQGIAEEKTESPVLQESEISDPGNIPKSDLIERFITEVPSMPRPKKEFFNPVNMAHKSTIDTSDLVSETLAEVHLLQGNVDKALKIYERLYLIIPEKSAYFAARIEKIKKENNLL